MIHKLLKYLVQGAIIYLLFKYVPKNPMKDNDILSITIIILLLCVLYENFYQQEKQHIQQPSCGCDRKEGFAEPTTNNSVNDPVSDMSSIGSSLQSANSTNDVISIAELNKMKEQSELAFKQSQQQILQLQSQLFGQQTDADKKQVQQVAQFSKPNSVVAPQVSYPLTQSVTTQGGYTKNADGTYTITTIDPSSQTPIAHNFTDYNTFPHTDSYEPGYSFLPPEKWYPTPAVPPVCVPSGPTCPVCPIYTGGTNMDLKEWNASLSVTPPEQINLKIN